ncbi:hypothetical protein B0H66DRAFT_388609 [Apodospora peruviana]|uniref:Uncharacterized protein n=1 Tax=Apodospora peruviana TaxID=516989 RepID=A0AAE0LZE3_9PEZI|nr:hypothetical protein B0H66DRAFT_388609 [Apodospora peruviana]
MEDVTDDHHDTAALAREFLQDAILTEEPAQLPSAEFSSPYFDPITFENWDSYFTSPVHMDHVASNSPSRDAAVLQTIIQPLVPSSQHSPAIALDPSTAELISYYRQAQIVTASTAWGLDDTPVTASESGYDSLHQDNFAIDMNMQPRARHVSQATFVDNVDGSLMPGLTKTQDTGKKTAGKQRRQSDAQHVQKDTGYTQGNTRRRMGNKPSKSVSYVAAHA